MPSLRRASLTVAFVLACAALPGGSRAASPQAPVPRPNIVLIVADDLGWGETGMQGGDIPTPRIDSLASNGVRFTAGYVSCPVCAPTRAGLMTGRYQQRFGFEFNPGPAPANDSAFGLPLDEATLAERLKAAGYATGMFGKWHLGNRPGYRPPERGFNTFFGFLGGAHSYLPGGRGRDSIFRGTNVADVPPFLTTALAQEAAAFIDAHTNDAFFLYVPFNAVHAPMQATDAYLERFKHLDGNRRTFAAMLTALDDAVGTVLERLRAHHLEQRTLIIFHSDNGGPTPQTTSRNGPLRATKGTVYEGGIRVPFVMQWPGVLPAGKTCPHPVIALDIHPTALAAAGVTPPKDKPLDGVNLIPFLTGERKDAPHDTLFWRMGPQSAARMGPWKLVKSRGGSPQLFNLQTDPSESRDVSAEHPAEFQKIQDAWAAWDRQLAAPRWGQVRRGGGKRGAVRAADEAPEPTSDP
jgi:arylsulfatase A-like enzyme